MLNRLVRCAVLLSLLVVLAGCPIDRGNTVTQYATLEALFKGVYDGDMSIGQLRAAGDFGLGTFNALDGEMVVVDGRVYQARSDGSVVEASNDMLTPFAVVLPMRPQAGVAVAAGLDFAGLSAAIDATLPSKNLIVAARIDGVFPGVKIRTVPRQQKPYPPLPDVIPNQTVTELANVEGTLVILRMPVYIGALNSAGYHIHFLSSDHRYAGHVLALQTGQHTAAVDVVPNMNIQLPATGDFLTAAFNGELAAGVESDKIFIF
jgi:acetolactate decarboxylase